MMPLLWIRIIGALAIALALAAAVWKVRHDGYTAGVREVQSAWDADIAKRTAQALQASEAARAKERALQASADKSRRENDAKILSLNIAVGELSKRLRDRPERPAGGDNSKPVAGLGANPAGCTGAQLYRADGEFLIGEAARADSLRIALGRCEAQYRQAQDAVTK